MIKETNTVKVFLFAILFFNEFWSIKVQIISNFRPAETSVVELDYLKTFL